MFFQRAAVLETSQIFSSNKEVGKTHCSNLVTQEIKFQPRQNFSIRILSHYILICSSQIDFLINVDKNYEKYFVLPDVL
jgi:hypothetical protein